jgi:hypothetical protein
MKDLSKLEIAFLAFLVGFGIAAIFMYEGSGNDRYNIHGKDLLLDRKTGDVWIIYGSGKVKVSNEEEVPSPED